MDLAKHLDSWVQSTEIKALLVRERYYRDTLQWQNLRQCYHPDASRTNLKITWFHGDVDGFVAGSERMAAGGTASTHCINPVVVQIHKGKAVSESTGSILARFCYKSVEYDLISYARFVSRLEKVDSEWKMVTLEVIYERDTIQPVLPGTGERIPPLEAHPRSNYRCLSWVLAQRGFAVDQHLPGSDVPGSAEKLLEDYFAWLHAD